MKRARKHLSADGLIKTVRESIRKHNLLENPRNKYSWEDCIMSGLAIFGLKYPSLLSFEEGVVDDPRTRANLKNLYGVKNCPSDTTMRQRLDQLSPHILRGSFKKIFSNLQRGKALEDFKYLDGHYLVSIDGTGHYSSNKVSCSNCCQKNHRNGTVSYYHQMLGAVLVHPEKKVVIPLAPEPIIKSDGESKNDCERNASKRMLLDLRREHPHLKLMIVEDGLASNFPHLSLLDSLNMSYVISAKPGDHTYLFNWIEGVQSSTYSSTDSKGVHHDFCYYNSAPLNDAHDDYKVNLIKYKQTNPKGKVTNFSWVTNICITDENVFSLMRAGRSRWRIENETFNTIKNQGYNFEHNYGHGNKNLCSVFGMLMMLAFLMDQVQLLCCSQFQIIRQKFTWRSLFEKNRVLFIVFEWSNWDTYYSFLNNKIKPLPD